MAGFFQPPAFGSGQTGQPEEAVEAVDNAPPWTGRPQGPPLGIAASDLLLARSELAAVYVAYIDAFPEGFELEITASTSIAYRALARDGDPVSPDVFGRHWPLVGERKDVIPPQLLRIGVQFADGRTATNISGHDRPAGGPIIWPLAGGGQGRNETRTARTMAGRRPS